MSPESRLWAAVIVQAFEDIEHLDAHSLDYQSARDFLTAGGAWGAWRRDVADAADIDFERIRPAAAAICARRPSEPAPPPPLPEPDPDPDPAFLPLVALTPRTARRMPKWQDRYIRNPFMAQRR